MFKYSHVHRYPGLGLLSVFWGHTTQPTAPAYHKWAMRMAAPAPRDNAARSLGDDASRTEIPAQSQVPRRADQPSGTLCPSSALHLHLWAQL